MSITETYAEFCTSMQYEDLPENVIEYAKHLLLDTVGIAVGSVRAESTDAFLGGTRSLDRDGDGATVMATGERMAPEYAALLNGALAHSLDYDDTHRGASLHPGAPVIPAALAAAEEADASGKELLTAIVAGYEITCRLGMAINPTSHYDRGFHMTPTCGVFGATAAVGMLRGFDEERFEAAFGLNGSQSAGSLQFLENGAWNKRAHPGLAGHSALVSAAFAAHGFFAANEPLEGVRGFLQGYSDDPYPEKATAGLGKEYELLNVGIKPYPCCRYMHAPMDVLFELAEREEIEPDEIERVTVNIATPGIKLTGDPTNTYPQSFVDCQFSMPFGAALVLARRDAGVDTFSEAIENGIDDELKRLIDTTTVEAAEWTEEAYPERWSAEVAIETNSQTYTGRTEFARGEPENPLSWDELVGKYEELTEPVMGPENAVQARKAIANVESISISELIAPFRAAREHAVVPGRND